MKLINILHNLGERRAEGLIAVPAEAEELLYAWIGEACVMIVRSWSIVFGWKSGGQMEDSGRGRKDALRTR